MPIGVSICFGTIGLASVIAINCTIIRKVSVKVNILLPVTIISSFVSVITFTLHLALQNCS